MLVPRCQTRALLQQQLHHAQVAPESRLVKRRDMAQATQVETQVGHETDRRLPVRTGGGDQQVGLGLLESLDQVRFGIEQRPCRGGIRRHAGTGQSLRRIELHGLGAVFDQVSGEFRMARDRSGFVHRPTVRCANRQVRSVVDEKLRPIQMVFAYRPGQLVAKGLIRVVAVFAILSGDQPVALAHRPQPMFQQHGETLATRREHGVVERLTVVAIGPGVEQQPGKRDALLVRRLVDRSHLALAEGTGQRREPVLASPHVVTVRVGAAFDEQPRDGQRRLAGQVEARIASVEQRLPVEVTAASMYQGRIRVEESGHGRHVACARCGPDIPGAERGVALQHLARTFDVLGQVRLEVGETAKQEEVREASRMGDVGFELPPGGKAVLPGHGEPSPGGGSTAFRLVGLHPGMHLGDLLVPRQLFRHRRPNQAKRLIYAPTSAPSYARTSA